MCGTMHARAAAVFRHQSCKRACANTVCKPPSMPGFLVGESCRAVGTETSLQLLGLMLEQVIACTKSGSAASGILPTCRRAQWLITTNVRLMYLGSHLLDYDTIHITTVTTNAWCTSTTFTSSEQNAPFIFTVPSSCFPATEHANKHARKHPKSSSSSQINKSQAQHAEHPPSCCLAQAPCGRRHRTSSVHLMFMAASSVTRWRNTYGSATRCRWRPVPHCTQRIASRPRAAQRSWLEQFGHR